MEKGKIHHICEVKQISILELAKLCGYNPNSLYNAINKRRISKTLAERIVTAFPDIRLEWLLGNAEYMNREEEEKAEREAEQASDAIIEARLKAFIGLCSCLGYELDISEDETEPKPYTLTTTYKGQQRTAQFAAANMAVLFDDICSYINFRLSRFLVLYDTRYNDEGAK